MPHPTEALLELLRRRSTLVDDGPSSGKDSFSLAAPPQTAVPYQRLNSISKPHNPKQDKAVEGVKANADVARGLNLNAAAKISFGLPGSRKFLDNFFLLTP